MSEYRLAPDWVDYTTLTTTDAYAVSNFPPSGYYDKPWRVNTKGVVTPPLAVASLSGIPFLNGGLGTQWDFGVTTPARYGWLRDTYGLGGKITYMTYRINPDSATGDGVGWIAVQGYFRLLGGILAENTDNANNIFMPSVLLDFSRGVLIAAP